MQVQQIQSRVGEAAADAVVVGVFEDSPLAGAAADVDAALGGAIRSLIERKEFTGRRYELAPLLVPMGLAKQTLVVGLGRKEAFDAGMAFRTAGAAAKHLAAKPRNFRRADIGRVRHDQVERSRQRRRVVASDEGRARGEAETRGVMACGLQRLLTDIRADAGRFAPFG